MRLSKVLIVLAIDPLFSETIDATALKTYKPDMTLLVESARTPAKVVERILTLCPGGPVGAVQARQGRLLLPRRMTIERVSIERRQAGMPVGRIVVGLSAKASGSVVEIRSGVPPAMFVVSAGVIAALVVAAWWVGGVTAAAIAAVALTVLEALRWKKALVGIRTDAAWLADQLR